MSYKKILFTNFTVTCVIYTIAYLVKTFIMWEFTNPFGWIINLPEYSSDTRVMILIAFLFLYPVQLFIVYDILKNKSKTKL